MKNIAKFFLVLTIISFPFFAPLFPGADRVEAMLQRALPVALRGKTHFVISQAYAQHHPGPEGDAHHSDGHGAAHAGGPGAAAAMSATRPSTEAAVHPRWTVGEYALDFSVSSHLQAGTAARLAVSVIDRQSGTPARGLPVELVLIPLGTPKTHGGHGMAMAEAADHPTDQDQVGSPYRTVAPLPLVEDEHKPGYYEARHAFREAGSHLLLISLRPDLREYAALPLLVEDTGGHQAGAAGPNYLFLGFLLSTVAVTILMVAFLRQREQPARGGEVR